VVGASALLGCELERADAVGVRAKNGSL
jgi:hypothetical protein